MAYTDDFQGYSAGNLAGQGNWNLHSFSSPQLIDVGGNIMVTGQPTNLYNDSVAIISGTFPTDQYAKITISEITYTKYALVGVIVRASTNNYYGLYVRGVEIIFGKNVADTWTNLGSLTTTVNVGDVFYLGVVGSTITVLRNGSPISGIGDVNGQLTDTSLTSGNPGIVTYFDFVEENTKGDNFECTSPLVIMPPNVGTNSLLQIGYSFSINPFSILEGYENRLLIAENEVFGQTITSNDLIGLSPIIEQAVLSVSGGGNAALSIATLSTAFPAVGQTLLKQGQVLVGSNLTFGLALLQATPIHQKQSLLATLFATGAPSVQQAAIKQVHTIIGNAILAGLPIIAEAIIHQKQSLSIASITIGLPGIAAASLKQAQSFLVNDITIGLPFIGVVSLSQRNSLTVNGLISGIPINSEVYVVSGEVDGLNVSNYLAGEPIFQQPSLSQLQRIEILNVLANTYFIDRPLLIEGVIPVGETFIMYWFKCPVELDYKSTSPIETILMDKVEIIPEESQVIPMVTEVKLKAPIETTINI